MNLQDSIKAFRIELGISQSELADKLKVNVTTVSRWENGVSYPKVKIANNILQLVKKSDLTAECKDNLIEALGTGRRQGTSASRFGFANIDQELISKIANDSANAVYAIDVDSYEILYINKTTEKLAKTELKNMTGKKCFDYIWKRHTPCKKCMILKMNEKEYSKQIIQVSDGRYLEIRGKKMKWNGRNLYISYVTDVTELMDAKKTVKQVMNLLPIGAGIYRVYKNGKIEQFYMNDMFYTMLGEKRETCIIREGLTALEAVHPDDKEIILKAIRMAIQDRNECINVKYRIDLGKGHYEPLDLHGRINEVTADYYTFHCIFKKID